jgi:competence protein ComEA
MNEPIYDGSHYFSKKIITVSVKGEVEAPGDYKIAQGTSVKEILEMAKPTERADLKKINLSRKLTRQNTIKIPSKKKTVSKPL